MMKASTLTLVAFLTGATAWADCPAAPDHTEALADLISQVRAAKNETQGRAFSARMWQLWADAPDEIAQAVLDRGMGRRESFDLLGAISDFDALIEYCPDYAEGYNQRAFANFLQGNFAPAVGDLQKAIELSPNHIAARAGLALTYMQLGDLELARAELLTAVELNPWLSERRLLEKGGPLALKGQDI